MQRNHFHSRVADQKFLLCYIIVSSLILMTSALTAKPRFKDFNLEQLKYDTEKYKIVTNQRPFQLNGFKSGATKVFHKMLGLCNQGTKYSELSGRGTSSPCVSRTSSSSDSMRNEEHFVIHTITGDEGCMFRALARGIAINDDVHLLQFDEIFQADGFKKQIKIFICDIVDTHKEFEDAIAIITMEETMESYCERLMRRDFWGGKAELMILSKLLSLPITVYVPQPEGEGSSGGSSGFIPIANYRPEFQNGKTRDEPKKDVRLLYYGNNGGSNHYDVLILTE